MAITATTEVTKMEALVELSSLNHGVVFFKDCPSVHTDPTWSTTHCGITTMKNVTSFLHSLRPKTDNVNYIPTQDYNQASISSSIMPSKASAIYTSSTTVHGIAENVPVPVSIGTSGPTPFGNLTIGQMSITD